MVEYTQRCEVRCTHHRHSIKDKKVNAIIVWLNIIFGIKYKNSYSILILKKKLLRFRLIILGSIRFMVDHSIQILSKVAKKTK